MGIQIGGGGGGAAATGDIGARVEAAAAQSINNNTATALTFSSETYDTDGMADLGAQATRLTCKTAGRYAVSASFEYAANATGIRIGWLYVNGAFQDEGVSYPSAGAGVASWVTISFIRNLIIDDYIEIVAYQTSGGGLNVSNKSLSAQLIAEP
jgi:hypothetical protein